MIQRRVVLAAAALGGLALPRAVMAAYPDKPVKIVVINAAGTATDMVARFLANHMANRWNSPVVVENKAGAGSTIAADFVVKSPADGATVLLTNGTHFIIPALYDKLPYDAKTDFAPVAMFAQSASVLMVPPDSPFRSVQDIVAEAKRRPGHLSFASAGTGSGSHLSGVLFTSIAGIQIAHVPYKISSQSLLDIASGQVNMGFGGISGALPLIKGGKVRPLAVTGTKRSQLLPALPTLEEAGLRGYELVSPIFALVRSGTPDSTMATLSESMLAAAATPEFRELCAVQGLDVEVLDGNALKAAIPKEFAKWTNLVVSAGAKEK